MSVNKELKDVLSKIERIGAVKDDLNILEDIRIHIYKEQLKRLINAVDIFKKIEQKLNESIEDMNVKDLINTEKALVKTIDSIQSLLRQFSPTLKFEEVDLKEATEEIGLSPNDNTREILKKIIANQVVNLVKQSYEIQKGLNKFKQGSIEHWKTTESLKSISTVISDLVKTMERIEGDVDNKDGLTIEDIVKIYEEEIAKNKSFMG